MTNEIYHSTYSGIPVYEFVVRGCGTMRRCEDGWVNATHILKVAGFDKPQRTRILEREVQVGVHEKIQGGYGKYQGTWVPLDRARQMANEYRVQELLAPLFDFETGTTVMTATKPKAPSLAALRRANGGTGTAITKKNKPVSFPPDVSTSAANAAATAAAVALVATSASGKACKVNEPNSASKSQAKRGPTKARSMASIPQMQPKAGSMEYPEQAKNVVITVTDYSESDFERDIDKEREKERETNFESADSNMYNIYQPNNDQHKQQAEFCALNTMSLQQQHQTQVRKLGVKNARVEHREPTPQDHDSPDENQEMYQGQSPREDQLVNEYSSRLLDFFVAPEEDSVPAFVGNPPPTFDINKPIDDDGNTAFHWACAIGHINVIEVLLSKGANTLAVSSQGYTPLLRTVMFTNSYERRTFPRIAEHLKSTVFYTNPAASQTVLHCVAKSAAKARSKLLAAAGYYMELIIAKASEIHSPAELRQWIDQPDMDGNTALHLAAQAQSRKCVKILVGYGANTKLKNNNGIEASELLTRMRSSIDSTATQPKHDGSSAPANDSFELSVDMSPSTSEISKQNSVSVAGRPSRITTETELTNQPHKKYLASPHTSEVAIRAAQRVVPAVAECLEWLASSYDAELAEKDADMEQVKQLLNDVEQETEKTKRSLSSMRQDMESIVTKYSKTEELLQTRRAQLRKVLERSQARDLALLVKEEEFRVEETLREELRLQEQGSILYPSEETLKLASELTELQAARIELVERIIQLWSSAGVGEKMENYRKVVSYACDSKPEEIDAVLDWLINELES